MSEDLTFRTEGDELPPAIEAVLRRTAARKLHVGGHLVVDAGGLSTELAFGCDDEGRVAQLGAPVRWSCTSKLSLAIACARLDETGAVSYDDPVCAHVPEFGSSGKDVITVRHLLTHAAGLDDCSTAGLDAGAPWDEVLVSACGVEVDRDSVGTTARYTIQTGWFLLAEIISRVTQLPPGEGDRRMGIDPLGLDNVVVEQQPGSYRPGRSTVGPIRELAQMCAALAPSNSAHSYLGEDVRSSITRPWRVGIVDAANGTDLSWGLGVAVDGRLFGSACAANTFGHLGQPGMFVLHDPQCGLTIAARLFGVSSEMHSTAARLLIVDALYAAMAISPT